MNKPTKRAKKVTVIKEYQVKKVFTKSSYTCPCCKTEFITGKSYEGVIRFRCKCGQELLIDNFRSVLSHK